MRQYHDVVRRVLRTGKRKENRTGVDTLSTFNVNYSIDLDNGFPLLTTKKVSWKNIVVENLWFLSGSENIDLLTKHGCRFWDPWADENNEVPSAYGHYWRNFTGREGMIDQIQFVIDELKRNPNSRRLVISAWDPSHALHSALPPCHLMYIFNVQRNSVGEPRLCLHLTQRSCDVALGLPYNIAGYGLIMHLMSRFTGIPVGTFGHTLIDAHIYTAKTDGSMSEYDHVPKLRKQLTRSHRKLPDLKIDKSIKTLDDFLSLTKSSTEHILDIVRIENYQPHGGLTFKVAV